MSVCGLWPMIKRSYEHMKSRTVAAYFIEQTAKVILYDHREFMTRDTYR